jgi:hypothetical protein
MFLQSCGSNIRFGELFLRLHVLDGSRSWGGERKGGRVGDLCHSFWPIVGPHVKTKNSKVILKLNNSTWVNHLRKVCVHGKNQTQGEKYEKPHGKKTKLKGDIIKLNNSTWVNHLKKGLCSWTKLNPR